MRDGTSVVLGQYLSPSVNECSGVLMRTGVAGWESSIRSRGQGVTGTVHADATCRAALHYIALQPDRYRCDCMNHDAHVAITAI